MMIWVARGREISKLRQPKLVFLLEMSKNFGDFGSPILKTTFTSLFNHSDSSGSYCGHILLMVTLKISGHEPSLTDPDWVLLVLLPKGIIPKFLNIDRLITGHSSNLLGPSQVAVLLFRSNLFSPWRFRCSAPVAMQSIFLFYL